jgi:hypothetical protein
MSARYRVKEHRSWFTPQRRLLGIWLRLAPPQPSMEAASQVIRERLRAKAPVYDRHSA